MPTTSSSSQQPPRPAPQVLNSRTLGRPVHLLPRFAEQLRQALDSLFRQQLNRRYRAGYEIAGVSVDLLDGSLPEGRWCVGGDLPWRVACLIERPLILSVMAHRYGGATDAAAGAEPRETATEERALAALSRQLIAPCLQLIDPATAPPDAISVQPEPGLARGCLIGVTVQEPGEALLSSIRVALGTGWLERLLAQLAAPRAAGPSSPPSPISPAAPSPQNQQLARRLALTLQARLLEQTLSLGELLDLRPGAVIPVRLKGTEVLVDGSRLFTASVAEHQGKLCLTSFADAE